MREGNLGLADQFDALKWDCFLLLSDVVAVAVVAVTVVASSAVVGAN